MLCGGADATDEGGHGEFLLVAVEGEAVDFGIGVVEADGVLGFAQIGAEEGVEEAAVHADAFGGHGAEDAAGDIDGHFVEALGGVARGEFLMLVVEAVADIDLADGLGGGDAEDLGKHAHFDPPIRWHARAAHHIEVDADFPRERVAEGVHVDEEGVRADDAFQRTDERGEHEAHDAAVEFVGEARGVALAEVEAEAVVGHRVAQAGQEFAVVGQDIAVVRGDDFGFAGGENVTVAKPHVAPFAGLAGVEVGRRQAGQQPLHARSVIPENDRAVA